MIKISKGRALLGSLITALALLALAVVPVMAQLPVFSPFYGDVTIDGADAPVGSQLKAYVDGAEAELLAPAVGNIYTLTTAGEYEIVIKADAKDELVTFQVKEAGTTEWRVAESDPASPVTSYENQNVDLTAGVVGPGPFTLSVTIVPAGKGTVDKSPSMAQYPAGTVVTLTADANTGWDFDYWSGDASGSNPTTAVTMNANKSVTAHFEEEGAPAATFKWWLHETFVECLMD
jgi:hypothetical protein